MECLDRHGRAKLAVFAAVNHSHAPRTDTVEHAVVPEHEPVQPTTADAGRLVLGQQARGLKRIEQADLVGFAVDCLPFSHTECVEVFGRDDARAEQSAQEQGPRGLG